MNLYHMFRRYTRPRTIVLAVILGGISGGSSTGLLALINKALTFLDPKTVPKLALGFAGLCAAVAVARFSSSFIIASLGVTTARELQVDMSRKILAAPLRRLEELGPHRLMASLTDDITAVTEALTTVPMMFINTSVVVGCLVYLGTLSGKLLLGVLVFMVLGISSYQFAFHAAIKRQELARTLEDDLFGHFRGVTQGTKELKNRPGRRRAFLKLVEGTADEFKSLRLSAVKIFLAAAGWGNLIFFVAIGLLLFFVPLFTRVDPQVSSGFVLVLLYMVGPLQILLNSIPQVTRATVAVRRIERLGVSLSEGVEDEGQLAAFPPRWSRLDLVGVTHAYQHPDDGSQFKLGPIDLTLTAGEVVFLVGGNGSGKTTLAKLLIGLYTPEEGEIRLDGRTIGKEQLAAYRQLFSVVFSDFFLFESLLGLDSPEHDAEARKQLEQLHLKHKVRIKDGRFSTTELSQGQRKRLALLAAYLEDTPIFLFDEWAADQDPEFKRVFYYQIVPQLKARGKTVVVISHDDAYYHVGDRIVKLDYGQVIYDLGVAETQYATA
jgi:putative pyoverdin transport system ATP-binding/permease protein